MNKRIKCETTNIVLITEMPNLIIVRAKLKPE